MTQANDQAAGESKQVKKRVQLVPEKDFDAVWDRTFEALHCTTLKELGQMLDVTKAAVWNVKEKRKFPAEWIVKLHDWYGISTEWLLRGIGNTKAVDPGYTDAIKHGRDFFAKVPQAKGVDKQGNPVLNESNAIFVNQELSGEGQKDYVWMFAPDNALAPEIRKDDVMYVSLEEKSLDIECFYVLAVLGKPFVRKVVLDSAELFLATESDPEDIPFADIEEKGIRVVGRVVKISRVL